ncbi:MAG TPA: gamma-glutamyltransferase family protein [Chloroflexota bacterium]|nr:gamma-glutamyltransferase family protein [Chloroflexota bacterium]
MAVVDSGQAWTRGDERPSPGVAAGAGGMVASASPQAAATGLAVLQRGGNAFDAALAVAGVEWLALPGACGLGGDLFAVLYDARRDRLIALNGSGEAARRASREHYLARGLTQMPLVGWDAAAVPGAPHAYATIHRELSTVPLGELWAPAIRYAGAGIAVTDRISRSIAGAAGKLARFPASAAIYLPGGRPPAPGTRWRNPDLADTIGAVARGGPDAFYRGEIAREIVRASAAEGGLLGHDEFAEQQTELYEPLRVRYRGLEVYSTRPPSQGLITLEILGLLEGCDLGGMGFGSAEALHAMVEAKKLAFADRLRYCGDPRFVDQAPVARLLDPAFHARRRAAIGQGAAEAVVGAPPETLDGDTSYFCVADAAGNMVSLIHSLSAGFGSGVVAGRTGVLLNNRAGRGFSLEAGHPNVFAGGKKTMHTLNCYLVARDGRPWLVGGTPGGDQQPQWNAQTIANVVDFGMDLQRAIEAPRWYSFPGTDPEHVTSRPVVRLEGRFGHDAVEGLQARGHRVELLGPWAAGGAVQLIARERDVLLGGSDPRAGGVALGY